MLVYLLYKLAHIFLWEKNGMRKLTNGVYRDFSLLNEEVNQTEIFWSKHQEWEIDHNLKTELIFSKTYYSYYYIWHKNSNTQDKIGIWNCDHLSDCLSYEIFSGSSP